MVFILLVAITNKANAFDIVSDPWHMAETVGGWSAQAKDMASQLSELKQQYDVMYQQYQTLQQEYQSISGIRDMGSLVNNPVVRKYLPDDYQTVLTSGYGNAQNIRDASRVIENDTNSDTSRAFEANGMQAAINRATAEEGYKQASQRFADIQTLLDKINTAPDQKSILDLQARIQAEQVMQQNEANKLAMLGQLAQAQRDLANQAAMERQIKSTSGGTMPENW